MPRSFLIKKNYSHCPLKKRPVLKLDDEKDVADNSEPENLSTKPEDLSMSAAQHQFPHKAITPPPAVALISSL
ncbi:Protein escargot, partial [Gryllus bimaculatus]